LLINVVRYKLPRVKHVLSICAVAEVIVLLCAVVQSAAQSGSNSNTTTGVVLTKLSPPIYPPLARQTRIAGDVELTLDVQSNGSVMSVSVVSGHALLTRAALQSAQQSQFECRNCSEGVRSYRLSYTFQLVGPKDCCTAADNSANNNQPSEPIPRVIQSSNHVTVIDQPLCSCGASTPSRKKVRSAKCLFLWKCGFARLRGYEW
jgi:TonB family protein